MLIKLFSLDFWWIYRLFHSFWLFSTLSTGFWFKIGFLLSNWTFLGFFSVKKAVLCFFFVNFNHSTEKQLPAAFSVFLSSCLWWMRLFSKWKTHCGDCHDMIWILNIFDFFFNLFNKEMQSGANCVYHNSMELWDSCTATPYTRWCPNLMRCPVWMVGFDSRKLCRPHAPSKMSPCKMRRNWFKWSFSRSVFILVQFGFFNFHFLCKSRFSEENSDSL